jgi:mRNA-degrading endonuclease RelE of RelBE toxin-antitoxin system
MNYEIISTPSFLKKIKKLSKKYPSLKEEILGLGEKLQSNPNLGVKVFKNCYKIRLAIRSKGGGKSGGVRIVTHVVIQDKKIYFLSIYDKSESGNIKDSEILELLKNLIN